MTSSWTAVSYRKRPKRPAPTAEGTADVAPPGMTKAVPPYCITTATEVEFPSMSTMGPLPSKDGIETTTDVEEGASTQSWTAVSSRRKRSVSADQEEATAPAPPGLAKAVPAYSLAAAAATDCPSRKKRPPNPTPSSKSRR